MVPLSLGLRSRLPLQDLGLPVHIDVSAGGNALWGLSISSASVQGESVAFATDNTASVDQTIIAREGSEAPRGSDNHNQRRGGKAIETVASQIA